MIIRSDSDRQCADSIVIALSDVARTYVVTSRNYAKLNLKDIDEPIFGRGRFARRSMVDVVGRSDSISVTPAKH